MSASPSQMRSLMTLLESVESNDIPKEISKLRQEFIKQSDELNDEQLDEVNWKKAAAGAAAAGALGAGALGAGDAKAQSVGDWLNLAQNVAGAVQQVSNTVQGAPEAPQAQQRQAAPQQSTPQQAAPQRQQLSPEEIKAQQEKRAEAQKLDRERTAAKTAALKTPGDLLDLSSDAAMMGSCGVLFAVTGNSGNPGAANSDFKINKKIDTISKYLKGKERSDYNQGRLYTMNKVTGTDTSAPIYQQTLNRCRAGFN